MATRFYIFSSNTDTEQEALAAEGYASKAIPDNRFEYLGSLGLTGALADRLLEYIENPPSPTTGAFSSAFSSAFDV